MQKSVKENRQMWIGGSDIPAIMGISPFTTRYDLLLFKSGIKENEFEGNQYTEYGNIMEPKIRNYINDNILDIYTETKYENPKKGIRCHLDGENKTHVLEIKTTSQIHETIDEYEVYLVQLLFYMMNVKKDKGILAVYDRPENFDEAFDESRLITYEININDYKDLCDEIMDSVDRFKNDLERLKENPLLSEEDLLPIPIQELSNKIIEIENQLSAYKELEAKQKELKKQLYENMVLYGLKSWRTPNGILITKVSGTEDKVEMVFNEDKFKDEQPVVYASYCEEKVKKGRNGSIRITL